ETTKADTKRRADKEARKAAFDQEPLTLPPGDPPGAGEPPAPTGDFHELPAKAADEEPKSELPEPALEQDNIGDLPSELVDLPEPVPEPKKGGVVAQPV